MQSHNINFSEMVMALAKPGADIIASLTPGSAHNLHMAVGISGEIGELLEAVSAPEQNRDDIVEELGDMEFYMDGLRQNVGITREQCLARVAGTVPQGLRATSTGIVGGAAMLLDAVKKSAVYCKDLNVDEVTRCLGLVEHDLEGLRAHYDITREECIEANIYKLALGPKARYKSGKYSNEQAQARADKTEA